MYVYIYYILYVYIILYYIIFYVIILYEYFILYTPSWRIIMRESWENAAIIMR